MTAVSHQAYAAPSTIRTTLVRRLRDGVTRLLWLHERRRQRRALLDLDDYLLRDIGKSRREALEEARKPFWR